eukprot:993925-Pelagomonas_calceolata.AAC.2
MRDALQLHCTPRKPCILVSRCTTFNPLELETRVEVVGVSEEKHLLPDEVQCSSSLSVTTQQTRGIGTLVVFGRRHIIWGRVPNSAAAYEPYLHAALANPHAVQHTLYLRRATMHLKNLM